MIQRAAQSSADVETACDSYGADRVEPVGVLEDLRFQRLRHQAAGETMGLDRMRQPVNAHRVPRQWRDDFPRSRRR